MDVKEILNREMILASASPRRKELMEKAGFQFEVVAADVEETFPEGMELTEIPKHIANLKAEAVAQNLQTDKIIIAADTIVVCEKKVLGKPKDLNDAKEMLQFLSGKQHQVITGVCLQQQNKKQTFANTTEVFIQELSNSEIEYYVNNYEVLDKAGAYAIQDWIGLNKINKIEGCYFNVVGLPVSDLYSHLSTF